MRSAAISAILLGALLFPLSLGAQNVLSATSASGVSGSTVTSQVLIDNDEAADGWSFGLCHDPAVATLLEAVPGATTQTVNNGEPPEFMQINVFDEGVVMGVVICISICATLPPGTGHEILDVEYELTAIPDVDPVTSEICFCSTLGNPPIEPILVVGGGLSITPETVCGVLTIFPPPDFCLELLCEGATTSVALSWEICSPFDYFLLHRDGELIVMLDAIESEYEDLELLPGAYHYALIGVAFPEPTGPPVILVAECDVEVIPVSVESITPDAGLYLGGTELLITGTGFMAAPDTTVELGGQPALDIQIIDDGNLTCVTPAAGAVGAVDLFVGNSLGEAIVPDGFTYGFIRGAVTEDPEVDLADAVFTLEWLFLAGAEPFCRDAMDIDDDGILDLADPVSLLMFLFIAGPPPAEPFDLPGLDPTGDDGIGCGP